MKFNDPANHLAACHFPLAEGEQLPTAQVLGVPVPVAAAVADQAGAAP